MPTMPMIEPTDRSMLRVMMTSSFRVAIMPIWAVWTDRFHRLRGVRKPFASAWATPSIAKVPGLRLVSRHGVGYHAVDVGALTARGIPLCFVGDVNSTGVAGHSMMLIVPTSHWLVAADRAGRRGSKGSRPPPLRPDHPLFTLDNAVMTPHNAALTVECAERMAISLVQNVLDFFQCRLDLMLIVNRNAF